MDLLPPEDLLPHQRLALAYAPARTRGAIGTALHLDNRLSGILRLGGEPMIAQIKLAWWRDRLQEDPGRWPAGEPLLQALRDWPGNVSDLAPLVDGWETLLAETFGMRELETYRTGRSTPWLALANWRGIPSGPVEQAAGQWALADLVSHLANAEERAMVLAALDTYKASVPRDLRPLAVLRSLYMRAVDSDGADPLHGPGALFTALRAGLSGR